MYKAIIADDEPIIRRGISHALDWKKMDIEIVGTAEDGKEAYSLCLKEQPDIVFVDICMPFMSGLELIEEVMEASLDCVFIIISGHDEFEYAKTAIHLDVVDYVLKPVDEEELEGAVRNAIKLLTKKRSTRDHIHMHQKLVVDHLADIQQAMIQNIVLYDHPTSLEELRLRQLDFLNHPLTLVLIKPIRMSDAYDTGQDFSHELLCFSVENIVHEHEPDQILYHSLVKNEFILVLLSGSDKSKVEEWVEGLQSKVSDLIHYQMVLQFKLLASPVKELHSAYQELKKNLSSESILSPMVYQVKSYIDRHYKSSALNLEEVAGVVTMNPTYLSRMLKQELNHTFIDYLTKVRIEKAVELMSCGSYKIYEVAEMVGYSSQHYFSKAFKRVMGVSPKHYQL